MKGLSGHCRDGDFFPFLMNLGGTKEKNKQTTLFNFNNSGTIARLIIFVKQKSNINKQR